MNLLYSLPNELIIYIFSFDPEHRIKLDNVLKDVQIKYMNKILNTITNKYSYFIDMRDETLLPLHLFINQLNILQNSDYILITKLISRYKTCPKEECKFYTIDYDDNICELNKKSVIHYRCNCMSSVLSEYICKAYKVKLQEIL